MSSAKGSLAAGFRSSCLVLGQLSQASLAAPDVPPFWLGTHMACTSNEVMCDQHTKVLNDKLRHQVSTAPVPQTW